MACIHPCTELRRSRLQITAVRISPVGLIPVGQNVSLSIDLKDLSWIFGEYGAIDIVDTDIGYCFGQPTGWISAGTTVTIPFDFPMPNKILHLRISASSWVPGDLNPQCEDYRTITICPNPPQGSCVSTSSSCDESTQIGMLGVCLPKNIIFIGIVLFGLYYMKNV